MSDITNRNRDSRASQPHERVRRRPHIDLGDTRSESFGEWLYSHRLGVLAAVVAVLIGGAWIATARVYVEIPPIEYIIEFVDEEPTPEDIEKLKQKRDQLQEEIDRRLAAVQKVKNVQSNDAAEEGGQQSQMYDSETQQMMNKVASDMASNRDKYNSGMKDVNGIGKGGSGNGSGGSKGDGTDSKFKGAVTVAYDIHYVAGNKKVARTARTSLYKPAYLGKEGGYVILDVKVDRNGTVKSAVVRESSNSALNSIAREAALNSKTLFNIDPNAPVSNVGTITYTFVAQ